MAAVNSMRSDGRAAQLSVKWTVLFWHFVGG